MQLILERGERLLNKAGEEHVVFLLKAQVMISEQERAAVNRYRLADEIVFQSGYLQPPKEGLLGLAVHVIAQSQIETLTVRDLVKGQSFECADVKEIQIIQAQLTEGARICKELIETTMHYSGRQVVEL